MGEYWGALLSTMGGMKSLKELLYEALIVRGSVHSVQALLVALYTTPVIMKITQRQCPEIRNESL